MSKNSDTHSVCNKHNIGGDSICCECSGKTDCSNVTDFIKQQQELAKEIAQQENLGYYDPRVLNEIITQIITNTGEELLRLAEGEKFKEYQYEHTYPNEIGVDMGNGYEKRIEAGQKQMMTHKLDDEEVLHNQAIKKMINIISKVCKKP